MVIAYRSVKPVTNAQFASRASACLLFSLMLFSCFNEADAKPREAKASRLADGHDKKQVLKRTQNAAVEAKSILFGKNLYALNECAACHSIGTSGCKSGVALDGIGSRRTRQFLLDHLKDPDEHVRLNSKLFNGDPNLMPNPQLSKVEINHLVDYLLSLPPIKKSAY